jgi:F-type H+-transporting ATPase subunit alpha
MLLKSTKKIEEVGHIVSYFSGVAKVRGLPNVFLYELLLDEKGNPAGLTVGFDEDLVEVLIFDEKYSVGYQSLFRSFEMFSIHASADYLGLVTDGFGIPLGEKAKIKGEKRPVFARAPQIVEREPVSTPLSTGIKLIDTVLPLGRGQRELIIGDRKLGKSTLAIDTVLNQKHAKPPVYCVYVLCGQKEQKLKDLVALFKKRNAFSYSVVVAATASSSFAEIFLAPFVGCTIAEYFRDQGKDALVVYDDLSQHAKAYRNIALLLERPPGREAYPGDIFSLHAGLLERAAKLSRALGGGSLSALPIIETQEGDITAFIPTNLISITDGQIYFERALFQKGFLPAVNVGLSVSRVGSRAQPSSLKEVTGGLRLALAQHKELQKLIKFETTKSIESVKKIHRGELLLELLKQEKHTNVSWEEQAVLFYVVESGYFDDLDRLEWRRFEKLFLNLLKNRYYDLLARISKEGLSSQTKSQIEGIIVDFKKEFLL